MREERRFVAKEIAILRRKSRMTQAELSAELGYARPTISSWERGNDLPGRDALAALAKLFDVSPDTFNPNSLDARSVSKQGELVTDPEELALLKRWRLLTRKERIVAVKVLGLL